MQDQDTRTERPVVVPDGVEYVEPEVRELARGIAADIRKYGHWQDTDDSGVGRVCIVLSPTYKATHNEQTMEICRRFDSLLTGVEDDTLTNVYEFNDSTPTADLLAALDRIAEGLVER